MGPTTQVGEVVLLIQGDRFGAGYALDDLGLVVLALVLEERDRLRALPHRALDRDIAFGNLCHALLDRG